MNITGSKRSDALLRLEAVLSSAPVVLFELDARGVVLRAEESGLRALGSTMAASLGRSIFDVLLGPPRVLDGLRGALAGEPHSTIAEVDGLCYELELVPLRDATGGVRGVLGLANDMPERTRATELLGTLDALVWTADASSLRFTFVSPGARAMTGYSEAEWIARPDVFAELLHPEEREVARDFRMGAVQDGKDRHWIHRVLTRDGRTRWFATTLHPMMGQGQLRERLGVSHVRELLGLMVDVSDHLHAEATLQRSEARLHLVLAQLPAIIWTTDRQLRFTTCVGAGLARVGIEENALVGHTVQQALRTDDERHPMLERLRKVIESGAPDRYDVEWLDHVYDSYVEPLRDSSGAVIGSLGLSLDVTERRATEAALRMTEESLRQAQKMEAIGRLAGGVAHDFNNILSIIACHADIILAHDPVPAGLHEIREAATRAADLTRQLLAFSRRQVLSPRVVDPGRVVGRVTGMLSRLVGGNIRMVVDAEPELGRVKVDTTQLEQVVMNLVVNARDAMPAGGVLTVATRNAEVAPPGAPVPPGAYVVISVADTGTGMDEATRARIFEPFFTTKAVGQGTGLGLSTVHGIVEQSGGRITVDSAPGRGTRFDIYLPVTEDAEAPVSSDMAVRSAKPPAATVLLVEDEDSVRAVVEGLLRANGYRVIAFGRSEEALRVAEAHDEPIDLLLTDVAMPRISGPALAERFLAANPGAGVLFMSGYAGGNASLAPGAAFLQKPFTADALDAMVRVALARRR